MADRTGWSWPRKVLVGVLALSVALALAFAWWVPSNDELAARLKAQAEASLGVPVHLGEVRWQFFPLAVVIENAATEQPAPIRIGRLVVEPAVRELLRKQLHLHHVTVQDAVLPQLSLRALRLQPAGGGDAPGRPLVEQLRFRQLTWITRQGVPLVFDGHVQFDPGWRPREGELMRVEVGTPARVAFRRLDDASRWQLRADLGGGVVEGELSLAQPAPGQLQLSGQLELRKVEVHSAMAAFHRNSVVRGQAQGRTELSARGGSLPELVRSLHTRTRFTMAPATLLRMDVDKAIRTLGKDRAGQTEMTSLAGQMETQNSADGIVFRYRGLEAKGETFSARGAATIANRRVNAEATVDIAGGWIGVPLKVTGPLASPDVSVLAAASPTVTAGAAIGTAILPGVGTVLGAGVGAAIDKLLGNERNTGKTPPLPRP